MKQLLIVVAMLLTLPAFSQIEEEYESQTFGWVDSEIYTKALSQMIRLDSLIADEVLVTYLKPSGERNKYLTKQSLRTYLIKNFYSPKEKVFKFLSEANHGYVLVYGQFGKDPDVAVRFWTIFIEQTTGKIVVIEIEENR